MSEEQSDCPKGACDYKPKIDARSHGYAVTPEMERYARIWFQTEYQKQMWERIKKLEEQK